MTGLDSAARHLRDSVAALPEYARADQIIRTKPATWTYDDTGNVFATRHHHEISRGPTAIGAGGFLAEAETNTIAEHIATTASPPTVLLLADLLEVVDPGDGPIFGENACDAMARERLAYYGYEPKEIHEAAQPRQHTDDCELTDHGWFCVDENEKPLHPLQDAYDEACEFVRWVLDTAADRLAPIYDRAASAILHTDHEDQE